MIFFFQMTLFPQPTAHNYYHFDVLKTIPPRVEFAFFNSIFLEGVAFKILYIYQSRDLLIAVSNCIFSRSTAIQVLHHLI